MEHFPINELLMSKNINRIIYNRGVAGFTTDDFIQNMDTLVFDHETISMPGPDPDDEWVKNRFTSRNNATLRLANKAVKKLAADLGCRFIDQFPTSL